MFSDLRNLEKQLWKAAETIAEGWKDLKLPRLERDIPGEERTEAVQGERVGYQAFKALLALNSIRKSLPRETPESIELGPLHFYLSKLWEHSKGHGVEFGRGGVLNVLDNKLELSASHPGTEGSCEIVTFVPQDGFHHYVLMMHTHPTDRGGNPRLHFSDNDFKGFFRYPEMLATYVISTDEIAMVLKTASSPTKTDYVNRRIDEMLEERLSRNGTYDARTWDFTRIVALEFGCSLYRNSRAEPKVLKKVSVTGVTD